MDIKKCQIGMKIRAPNGYEGKIVEIHKHGAVYVDFGPNMAHYCTFPASDLEPIVPDACASCEMAPVITSQCKQIADLQKSMEHEKLKSFWEGRAAENTINCDAIAKLQQDLAEMTRIAAYWREELTKLQNEALADCDCKPLGEVAKIYVQVAPEKLLLSQNARRVVELLTIEGPSDYRSIAVTFGGDWGKTMDGIIEARDAGRIELVDGKYQVKEE